MGLIKFIGTVVMVSLLMAMTIFIGCKKENVTVSCVKMGSAFETIKIGSTLTLSYTYEPQDAVVESAVWTSSAENVASVDQNGVVTGLAVGTTTINIRINGQHSAVCTVTVKPVVTGIKIGSAAEAIEVGSAVTLSYTAEPEGSEVESEEWSSDDTSVATVDQNGTVTGVAFGTASITIMVNNQFTATCKVTVNPTSLGIFTVGDDKKVKFSPGNLQASIDASGNPISWRFTANQYDLIGKTVANTSIDEKAGYIDLFGWSTDGADNNYGIHTNTSVTEDCTTGNFEDWGSNATLISELGPGWFTLSSDEWEYLLNFSGTSGRTDAVRFAKAKVNSVKGLLIFPDGYTGTASGDGIAAINSKSASYPASSISSNTWPTMENDGCVFLPMAGCRIGTGVIGASSGGYYWTSSHGGTDYAYDLHFGVGVIYMGNSGRFTGYSVRLVRE